MYCGPLLPALELLSQTKLFVPHVQGKSLMITETGDMTVQLENCNLVQVFNTNS